MGALFTKAKREDSVTEADRAVLALKLQRDKLKIAYKRYESNLGKEKEMARTLLKNGRKDRALIMLKRKRYQETLMGRIAGQLDTVERMVHNLETAQLNKDVYEQLKKGNEALQVLNEAFSIEDAQKIMEDTREAAAYQEEISQALSTTLTEKDLEKVEEEYEALVDEAAKQMELPPVPLEEPELTSEPVAERAHKKRRKEAVEAS